MADKLDPGPVPDKHEDEDPEDPPIPPSASKEELREFIRAKTTRIAEKNAHLDELDEELAGKTAVLEGKEVRHREHLDHIYALTDRETEHLIAGETYRETIRQHELTIAGLQSELAELRAKGQ